jgi:hypothetical protein
MFGLQMSLHFSRRAPLGRTVKLESGDSGETKPVVETEYGHVHARRWGG